MSSITTLAAGDLISTSRTDINDNFSALNTDKIETSTLDTDTSLAANSDAKIATQKAVKAYVLANVNPTGASWNEYAADAGSSDAYVITLTGVSAYATGQTFKFKANTANTGACTLKVNSLAAITIKKDVTSDLATGDILANQIVTVIYDGTNMQLVSQISSPAIPIVRTYLTAGSPATWTKPTGLKYVIVEVQAGGGTGGAESGDSGGGGGGGGGYSRKLIATASLGATETVTTGAGGANSSFGTHATATTGANGSGTSGGAGGIGSSGDINLKGQTGAESTPNGTSQQGGGSGGSSHLGGGGGSAGAAGGVYGGGGAGTSSGSGGAGAAGIVIVTEYYS